MNNFPKFIQDENIETWAITTVPSMPCWFNITNVISDTFWIFRWKIMDGRTIRPTKSLGNDRIAKKIYLSIISYFAAFYFIGRCNQWLLTIMRRTIGGDFEFTQINIILVTYIRYIIHIP